MTRNFQQLTLLAWHTLRDFRSTLTSSGVHFSKWETWILFSRDIYSVLIFPLPCRSIPWFTFISSRVRFMSESAYVPTYHTYHDLVRTHSFLCPKSLTTGPDCGKTTTAHIETRKEKGRKLTSIDVLMSVCVSCLVCSRLENSSSRGFFSLLLRVFVPQERYLSRHRVCLCSYRVSWDTIVGCEGHDQGFVLTTSLTNKTAYKTVCRPVFPSFKADKNNSRVLVL